MNLLYPGICPPGRLTSSRWTRLPLALLRTPAQALQPVEHRSGVLLACCAGLIRSGVKQGLLHQPQVLPHAQPDPVKNYTVKHRLDQQVRPFRGGTAVRQHTPQSARLSGSDGVAWPHLLKSSMLPGRCG